MSPPARRRGRDLKRRPPFREPRKRVLIVCEGSKREPDYFRGFCRCVKARLVEIDSVHGAPRTLVQHASDVVKAARRRTRREDANLGYDEVWCVFDVDEHPGIPDATQQAKANGIRLAISNPCFELWLLIHFRDQNSWVERDRLKSACRQLPESGRDDVPCVESCMEHYEKAVSRARGLDQRHERNGQPGENPSTGIYRLTERILEIVSRPT